MFLKTIIQNLLAKIRSYGILGVSLEQYRVVCNEFLRFFITKGINTYSDQIMADYLEAAIARCDRGASHAKGIVVRHMGLVGFGMFFISAGMKQTLTSQPVTCPALMIFAILLEPTEFING